MDSRLPRTVYRGKRVSLQVLDRDLISACYHDEPYAVISIVEPGDPFPKLVDCEFLTGVLRVEFSDIEGPFKTSTRLPGNLKLFTPEIASEIAEFVRNQQTEGTELFVVQCEAGVSRSAGVGAALDRFYNQEESYFRTHFYPNEWVRALVLNALEQLYTAEST